MIDISNYNIFFCSTNAQQDIETLADRTHGKSYYVADFTGPDQINDAISGASQYQPDKKSSEKEVLVLQKSFTSTDNIVTDFYIDQFLGKFLKIQIDVSPEIVNQDLGSMNLYHHTDGDSVSERIMIDSNSVFQYFSNNPTQGTIDLSLDLVKRVSYLTGS